MGAFSLIVVINLLNRAKMSNGMNLGELIDNTHQLTCSVPTSSNSPSKKKPHPCEQTLDFLIPEQINAFFIRRLFALNESLASEDRKSRSQLLHDVFLFQFSTMNSISTNEENLIDVLNHLSTYESCSRILSKLIKSESESRQNHELLFSFALAKANKENIGPFLEAIYKDDAVYLKKVTLGLSVERKRLVCATLCDFVQANDLNDIISVITQLKLKKSNKSKSQQNSEAPFQLYLSSFKRLKSQAFDEIQKMLTKLELEEFLPGFKHAMIHDKVLFELQPAEVEQLLSKMGLPLGVQLQIKKYVAKQQKTKYQK